MTEQSYSGLGLPGPEPTAPEVLPIRAIHRHGDGVITFHRKTAAGDFRNLFAIRCEHLEGMFPQFQEQLETDAYFSVNAFWHRERHPHYLNATEARQSNRLRYLCANYVDLDTYKTNIDFGAALGTVISYQDQGTIPPASVIARSGRGIWLLWLLRDAKHPGLPQRAWPEKLRLYLAINRAAGERLAEFGADAAARDALRVARVPGSINSKVTQGHKRVKFWLQCGVDAQPVTYTLDELAKAFGVESDRLDSATRRAFDAASLPAGARLRSHTQLNARRLREFDILRTQRGGFEEGRPGRHWAALIYAWLLKGSGMPREGVLKQVERLGQECRPPLDLSSCRLAVKSAFARKITRMTEQRIADLLDITPVEAEYMEKLPPASRFRVGEVTLLQPPINAERRRAIILDIVRQQGTVPSCRQMVQILAIKGHPISRSQVSLDYKELSLTRKVEWSLPESNSLFSDNQIERNLQS